MRHLAFDTGNGRIYIKRDGDQLKPTTNKEEATPFTNEEICNIMMMLAQPLHDWPHPELKQLGFDLALGNKKLPANSTEALA